MVKLKVEKSLSVDFTDIRTHAKVSLTLEEIESFEIFPLESSLVLSIVNDGEDCFTVTLDDFVNIMQLVLVHKLNISKRSAKAFTDKLYNYLSVANIDSSDDDEIELDF